MRSKGPVNSIEQFRDFWETCHKIESVTHLSGAQYDPAMGSLKIEERIRPGTNVLEVGVGMGYITQGLQQKGAKVSALDISQTALDRVNKYCEEVYLIEDMGKIPSDHFDVIVCCNMVQHVHTDLLKQELGHFIRSLADGGVLALQFVSNNVHHDMGAEATLAAVQSGILCRSPQFMKDRIEELGGQCEHVVNTEGLRKGKVNGNHVFHVTKKSEEPKKKKKDKKDKKNPSAQIRSGMGYDNPHDY